MFKAFSKLKRAEKCYDELRRKLNLWYCGHIGQQFLALFQSRLDQVLSNLFGYHLLQIGSLGSADLLKNSRIKHRLILDGRQNGKHPSYLTIPCDVDRLAIATDSVDVVVLPHTLEIHAQAHQVLREVDRILVPEGRVVIVGFNPYSLWGFVMWLRNLFKRLPWHGRFLSPHRVKDWFALLGYEVEHFETYFYRPPFGTRNFKERSLFFERLGARYWPIFGGGYILVAKKQVATMTPLRPSWRVRRRFRAIGVTQSSLQRDIDEKN